MNHLDDNSLLPYPSPFEEIVLTSLLEDFSYNKPEMVSLWSSLLVEMVAKRAFGSDFLRRELNDRILIEHRIEDDLLVLFRRLAEEKLIEKYVEKFDPSLNFEFLWIPSVARTRILALSEDPSHQLGESSTPWQLIEDEKVAVLQKDGVPVMRFASKYDDSSRYFKCLWENRGKRVTSQQLYDFQNDGDRYGQLFGPHTKTKPYEVNKNIRDTIQKLKKKLPVDCGISIKSVDGYLLTIV